MGTQHQRLRVFRLEALHQMRPEVASRTQLGCLHEKVHTDAEEEGKPRCKDIDIKALVDCGLHIFKAIGQSECQLQGVVGSSLLDMIAGDRNGIEARHVVAGVLNNVGNDPHRRCRRIYVSIADHELFEDIVLNSTGQLLRGNALLFGGDYVVG